MLCSLAQGGQKVLPSEVHDSLILGNCDYVMSHGKRDFEDVIKATDLKIGKVSWIT